MDCDTVHTEFSDRNIFFLQVLKCSGFFIYLDILDEVNHFLHVNLHQES